MAQLEFPTPDGNNTYRDQVAAWVRFSAISFSTIPAARVAAQAIQQLGDTYILPLQRFNSANKAQYKEEEPGSVQGIFQGLRDLATGDLTKIGSAVAQATGVSQIIDAVAGAGGAATLDVSLADQTFKGTQKRIHTFGFTLLSKNAKEAQVIDEIAQGFQKNLYPLMLSSAVGKVKPPPMWRINIVPNGGTSNSKILTNDINLSVLDTCTINRLDRSAPVLTKNGYFLGLDLALSFVEIEPAFRSWGNAANADILSRSRAAGFGLQEGAARGISDLASRL